MKFLVLCLLMAANSHFLYSQISYNGEELEKQQKSADEKVRLSLSAHFKIPVPLSNDPVLDDYRMLPAVGLFYKNLHVGGGPLLIINRYNLAPEFTRKSFGYSLALRYIFPQNKGFAKAYIPVLFEQVITQIEVTETYNHLATIPEPEVISNPGYSFDFRRHIRSSKFDLSSGLGVFIWLGDHFHIQLEATAGARFNKRDVSYFSINGGELLGAEPLEQTRNISAFFSAGAGFRF